MTDGFDQKRIDDLVHERDALLKEIEDTKALVRQVVRLEGKSWYSLVAERVPALALVKWSDSRYVEFKPKEHPCKKHKHHPKDGPCIPASAIPQGPSES